MIIKIYKQRVKHLLYEHQNEVTTAKTDSEIALKLLQDENRGKESELKSDKRALKLEKKEVRTRGGEKERLKRIKGLQATDSYSPAHLLG